MMVIDMEVAAGLDCEVEEPVAGETVQHMVKKWHARIYFAATVAVEAEADGDLGLASFAADFRYARRRQRLLTVSGDRIFSGRCRARPVMVFHLCSRPRFGADRGSFFVFCFSQLFARAAAPLRARVLRSLPSAPGAQPQAPVSQP